MEIVNVGYRSVNCYLLITSRAELLIDVGWPGGMPDLKRSMALHGLSVKDVTHVLVTHYHVDHGGIAQEMKDKGAKLVVMENQKGHLNDQMRYVRPPATFHEISDEGNIELRFADSREFLADLGIQGEIVPTPGHGDDHVTLVLDDGIAFTGDLPPPGATEEGTKAYDDWARLRRMRVRRVFPAHGPQDLPLE